MTHVSAASNLGAMVAECPQQELALALAQEKAKALAAGAIVDQHALRLMKKRLQDRLYQRKHRAKRDQKLHQLELQVHGLHSKIARLHRDLHRGKVVAAAEAEQRRQEQQQPRGSLEGHASSVVLQYFRMFQRGYSLQLAAAQERFLRSVLATGVEGVDRRGVDHFVEQWRLYGQHFAVCTLEPHSWRVQGAGDTVMVVVDVEVHLRFHRQTIGALFPSLKTNSGRRICVQPLVAGIVVVEGTYTFTLERTGFVSSLLVSLQLLEALRRALGGSLVSVAQLVDGTRLALGSGTITLA